MSAQAEEFARQLLEKTENHKLRWQFVPDREAEMYKYNAEDEISFSVRRIVHGDDKTITFELAEPGRVVLSDTESNTLVGPKTRQLLELREAMTPGRFLPLAIGPAKVERFRLYSDLFYAARETAEGKDEAIEKAQQFLARLA